MTFKKILILLVFSFVFSIFPLSANASEDLSFLHQDHLSSTSLVTNETGEVISRQVYFPYGSTRHSEENLPTERQYTGQVSDQSQTGLYYYNARYYDPQIAKFTQADTEQGPNRYGFVGNNPLKHTDPSGHQAYNYFARKSCIEYGIGCGGSENSSSGYPLVNWAQLGQIVDYVVAYTNSDINIVSHHNQDYNEITASYPKLKMDSETNISGYFQSGKEALQSIGVSDALSSVISGLGVPEMALLGHGMYSPGVAFDPVNQPELARFLTAAESYIDPSGGSVNTAKQIAQLMNLRFEPSSSLGEAFSSGESSTSKWFENYYQQTSYEQRIMSNSFICQDFANISYLMGQHFGINDIRLAEFGYVNNEFLGHRVVLFTGPDGVVWVLDSVLPTVMKWGDYATHHQIDQNSLIEHDYE